MTNIKSILLSFFRLFLAKTYCSVCDKRDCGFGPLPDFYRANAEKYGYLHFGKAEMTALDTYFCSNCGASDRERLYAYYLQQQFSKKSSQHKAIHFAPEHGLSNFIRQRNLFLIYQTADFMMEEVDHKVDLMNLPFSNETYDFFICSHVLEHVTDDRRAISELYRVTKQGGRGIIMVPIITNLPKTIEDPSITDEGERWRLFGQNDHVRLYSRNEYILRIKKAGFYLELLDIKYFGLSVFKKLGLKLSSVLYIAIRP